MNRIALLIPYFGKFNNYFHLWLESASQNRTVDFFIITNNRKPEKCGDNVFFLHETFDGIKKRIEKVCGVKKAKLKEPYKLCEYKLLYGKIFQEEIKQYEFWGFCDVDLIFGHINDFITDDLLDKYDKFYSRGHLTIFRNNDFFRNMYLIDDYRMRINNKIAWRTNHCVHFDELPCWNEIIKEKGYKCYDMVDFCDIEISKFRFVLAMGDNYSNAKQIFEYRNGKLLRYYLNKNKQIVTESVLYVHLQKRDMQCLTDNIKNYLIIPNSFVDVESVDYKCLNRYSEEKSVWGAYVIKRIKEIEKNIRNGALKIRIIVLCRRINKLWKKSQC